MPDSPFRVTLEVTNDCEVVLEKYCVNFLTARGFNVAHPHGKWETIAQFKTRLGICYGTVARKVRDVPQRPNVIIQRGEKSKQIVAILSNKDFDAYCVAGK